MVDLQCQASLRYKARWSSYTYIIYSFSASFPLGYYKIFIIVPCTVRNSRPLLVIYQTISILHTLTY